MTDTPTQGPSKGSSRGSSERADSSTKRNKSRGSRVADSANEKPPTSIRQQFDHARLTMMHFWRSQTYVFPLKGISFFWQNRVLWTPFLSMLWPYTILYITITAIIFFMAYPSQLAVLMSINGPLAVPMTILLILNESSAIMHFISRAWLIRDGLIDTFDATLICRNQVNLVRIGRGICHANDQMNNRGRVSGNLSLDDIIRFLLYLPLNLIPFIGTLIFIVIQGRDRGKMCHERYFQLKDWSPPERESWLEQHGVPYTKFGIMAALLELIPVASMFFTFTNTVGAAIWAADIEDFNAAMNREYVRQFVERLATNEVAI